MDPDPSGLLVSILVLNFNKLTLPLPRLRQ